MTSAEGHTGDVDQPIYCPDCGSQRIMAGPNYEPTATVCLDCGYRNEDITIHFEQSQTERAQEQMATLEELAKQNFPTDPVKLAEFNKLLREAQAGLGNVKPAKARKATQPKVSVPETEVRATNIPPKFVWQVVHIYTRDGSTWQQTISDAKEEIKFRGDSVLIVAHNHIFNDPCSDKCKQFEKEN